MENKQLFNVGLNNNNTINCSAGRVCKTENKQLFNVVLNDNNKINCSSSGSSFYPMFNH
jgi:hypothetical protein